MMPTTFAKQFTLLLTLLTFFAMSQAHDIRPSSFASVEKPDQLRSNGDQAQYRYTPSQDPLLPNTHHDGLFAEDAPFLGLSTFANLPYVHCLSDQREVEKYDIAILGAPFDTGTTGRPGARFGPRGIRAGSARIAPDFQWDYETGRNPFRSWAKVVDCGDAPLTFLDNRVALRQLGRAHEIISSRPVHNSTPLRTTQQIKTADRRESHPIPRIITLGGDHTTTLPALRSTFHHHGPISVIHFDSHLDTWDPSIIGGGFSHYAGVNHGTFLHVAAEEGLIKNESVHVGIRAPLSGPRRDVQDDRHCGFRIITSRDLDRYGIEGVVERIKKRVGGDGAKVYISVDIDVLDPAFAPGTGTAEVGGWNTRELLWVLEGLSGLAVVGADVVEVAPAYDNVGETTVLAAAEIAKTLLGLMVDVPVLAGNSDVQ